MSNIANGPAATLASSASSVKDSMLAQYSLLSKQMEQQISSYEKSWCTPGKFTPGSKKPATFIGHSMSLTFDSGSCFFNDTKWLKDGVKELNCTEPSITYEHSPANFTSAHHAAAKFTSQYCQISKAFGEPVEKVLFVFDGQYTDGEVVDVQSLTEKITGEVSKLLSTMTSSVNQIQDNLFSGFSGLGTGAGGLPAGAL